MPKAQVGDIVLWYDGAVEREDPTPAIVTRLGFENLCMNVFSTTSGTTRVKDGVRHMDDPRAKAPELAEQGGWRHRRELK